MALLTEILATSGLVTKNGVETLNNKTFASPVISGNTDMNGNLDVDGNINFTGTARRITGRFSGSTSLSDQLLVQTNLPDNPTGFYIIPNGAANSSAFGAFNKADPDNSSLLYLYSDTAVTGVSSIKTGTGAYLPLIFEVGGASRLRIDPTTGNVIATSGALGYGVGAGGTVVQATSKSTAVTLNKPSGQITMHNESLAAGATARFILNNTYITASDEISVWISDAVGNAASHIVWIDGLLAGLCAICVKNISTWSLPVAFKIGFAVRKGATS